jgi:integrase/recombinase XerD
VAQEWSVERDVTAIKLLKVGRVSSAAGVVPWVVLDGDGIVVEPVRQFLRDFVASGNRPTSVRSYAFALLRWWRWLVTVDVAWDKATSAEVRDLVLWLQHTVKVRNSPRTTSAATVGTVNAVTRKAYPGDSYAARTVRHSNAVIRSFYEFWLAAGEGPLLNPVPLERGAPTRAHAHRNPLERYRPAGRLRYNPRVPGRRPRAMPDEQWSDLFGRLRSNRDRAIVAFAVSNGARATELLGIRGPDLDWGEQLVRVVRKGTWAEQWLPASPEAFVWLRLYLAELCDWDPAGPVWWTLRRRNRGRGLERQPMSYEALRAVFRRVNAVLGTNWSMHDLRHTCSLRMARDETLSLRDVQNILGHAHLSTTADVYMVEEEAAVIRRVSQHLTQRSLPPRPREPVGAGYDDRDLSVLFGTGDR